MSQTNGNSAFDEVLWWKNPDRNCLNDIRFVETPRGWTAEKVKSELIYLCMTCPVFKECAEETERLNRETRWVTKGVVQAGVWWQ